jgi:hypothetical protein
MTLSSTGKDTDRLDLSLPLLGVLPDEEVDLEEVDLEQAALCGYDDKRGDDGNFDPNFHYGFLVLILSALQLLVLSLPYHCKLDDSPDQALPLIAVVSGTALFCAASILYKVSIKNNPAVLFQKGWWNVVFATVLLAYLMHACLLLLQLGLAYWLDNAERVPTFMSVVDAASLLCGASVLYMLSLKNSPVSLVPEVWINVVFATALLIHVEVAFQVLMLGTIVMSLAAGASTFTSSR